MDRQIFISAIDLLLLSLGLTGAFFMLFVILIRNGKASIWVSIRLFSSKHKLMLFLPVSFSIIMFLGTLFRNIFNNIESAEWLTYVVSSISISFFAGYLLIRKDIIKSKWYGWSWLLSFLVILMMFIYLTIFIKINILFLLTGLFIYIFINKESKNDNVNLLLGTLFLTLLVLGFFINNIRNWNWEIGLFLAIFWVILSLIGPKAVSLLESFKFKWLWLVIFWLILIVLEFAEPQKIIDYHHFSFYLGPIFEASNGKSLLLDVASQYGYWSIHFLNTIFQITKLKINFVNFHYIHTLILATYFLGFFGVFYRLTKRITLSSLLLGLTVAIQTIFLQFSGLTLPPSTGPMRFGIGLIILLTILFTNNKLWRNIWLFFWSVASTLWSVETLIYNVPAIVITMLADAYLENTNLKEIIKDFLIKLGIMFGLVMVVVAMVIGNEFLKFQQVPEIHRYWQFAITYKNGFGSIPIPLFGNYYLVIAILIMGVYGAIRTVMFMKKNKNTKMSWAVLALVFLAIHNVAIFSYFVSRSAYTNILNISPFMIVQAVLLLYFVKDKRIVFKYFYIPATLFLTLFTYVCSINISGHIGSYSTELEMQKVKADFEIIKQVYELRSGNTIILSRNYDTFLETEFNLSQKLPLNPSLMSIILPNYKNEYLDPNLGKVDENSVLVYTQDMPEIFEYLSQNFRLIPLPPKTRGGNTIVSLGNFSLYRMNRK